eukprot:4348365-Prymnesium_polylepis.2
MSLAQATALVLRFAAALEAQRARAVEAHALRCDELAHALRRSGGTSRRATQRARESGRRSSALLAERPISQ